MSYCKCFRRAVYIDAGNYLEKIFPAMGIRYIAINDNYDSMAPGSSTDVITPSFQKPGK